MMLLRRLLDEDLRALMTEAFSSNGFFFFTPMAGNSLSSSESREWNGDLCIPLRAAERGAVNIC